MCFKIAFHDLQNLNCSGIYLQEVLQSVLVQRPLETGTSHACWDEDDVNQFQWDFPCEPELAGCPLNPDS